MNKFLTDYETNHVEPGNWDIKVISEMLTRCEYQV